MSEKETLLPTKCIFGTVAVPWGNGAFSLWCRKGKAFCQRSFALLRQQPERNEQIVDFAPPGKISSDVRGVKVSFGTIIPPVYGKKSLQMEATSSNFSTLYVYRFRLIYNETEKSLQNFP